MNKKGIVIPNKYGRTKKEIFKRKLSLAFGKRLDYKEVKA